LLVNVNIKLNFVSWFLPYLTKNPEQITIMPSRVELSIPVSLIVLLVIVFLWVFRDTLKCKKSGPNIVPVDIITIQEPVIADVEIVQEENKEEQELTPIANIV